MNVPEPFRWFKASEDGRLIDCDPIRETKEIVGHGGPCMVPCPCTGGVAILEHQTKQKLSVHLLHSYYELKP